MSEFLDELREIEVKWQKRWQKDGIFIGKIDSSKPKWYITVPYPYASGPLHIGHCRTYNLGDIFARYKRQQGFNVMWPMAFHITGTPILSVAAKIKDGDSKTIALYKDYISIYEKDPNRIEEIISSFTEPMNVAMYFAGKLIEDFLRMGFSIDDTRQFTTGDPEYNKFIEWQYLHLYEKGLITTGTYPILYCTRCQNAVGEDDIQSGDEQKVEVTEFVGIKYRLEDNRFLIAATLRPETIFGATNIWIHPEGNYKEIEIENEHWIISQEAAQKLKEQMKSFKVIKTLRGIELVGKEVEVPITKAKVPIYPATFVDTDHATGVVYSVPAHAPYDYAALVDLQKDEKTIEKYNLDKERLERIKPISLIKIDGYGDFPAVEICEKLHVKSQNDYEKLEKATQTIYKEEFYSGVMKDITGKFKGLKVEEAKVEVAKELKKLKLATEVYETSSKALCRCGGKIIVAVLPEQYFLNYGDKEWKKMAYKALNNMEIIPNKYRQMFENTFDWLDKRPCVRKRGLGTEFPITKGKGWIIESLSDSVIYMAFYTIIKVMRNNNVSAEQLLPELFDYVFLNTGDIKEVAKKTGIDTTIITKMKEEFEYWYPNDFRHTAIAHISNHLSFTIFHHVAIFPEKYWPKAFSLNELLIREGQKMGKSKGNVIPMAYIPQKYSVDLTRLHLAAVATADSVVDWREKEVKFALQRLKKFWDYAQSIFNANTSLPEKISFQSKILLSSVKSNAYEALKAIERYNARDYVLMGFYANIRALEDYEKVANHIPEIEKKVVIRNIIELITKIISPVIPHICEEIYERLGNKDYISLVKIPTVELTEEDRLLATQAKFISNVIEDLEQIEKLVKTKPSKIYIYVNAAWKNHLYTVAQQLFKDEAMNIGKLMAEAKKDPELQRHMKEIANEAKIMQKDSSVFRIELLSVALQKQALEGYRSYIQEKFGGAEVIIFVADETNIYDPQKKSLKARPMKPAIYVE
ncbi:MAG: leucine--tRNA ligase [Candidatus Heimdallarchaeaceae archaeon]